MLTTLAARCFIRSHEISSFDRGSLEDSKYYHTLNFLDILRLDDGSKAHIQRHGDVAGKGSTRESSVQVYTVGTHLFVLCFGEPARKREPFAIKTGVGSVGFQVCD